jgi:hypothetical protein
MDNAQFSKTGGTWTNRVKMIVNREPAWVTLPIVRAYHGVRTVDEMRLSPDPGWRAKALRTVELSYKRAPHFDEVFPRLEPLVANPTDRLADYNLTAIRSLCETLRIGTPIVLGTSLHVDGRATDLLIRMVNAVSGTAYLAGGGSAGYQEDDRFREAGIELIYQEFQHPVYPQINTPAFQPGLSVVDALMNLGFEGTARLLAGQR